MSYFAAALLRRDAGWSAEEIDLDEVEDLEALAELLRDLTGEGPGPAVLLLEENDEYVAVVRVDGGVGALAEPRVFLSDRRAVQGSDVAAMLWEEADPDDEDLEPEEDDDEGSRPVADPVGDAGLLEDLGVTSDVLLALCAEEGRLPADVHTELCILAGCDDVLEKLREG